MTMVRVRGLKRYRHPVSGIVYVYHRRSGTRIFAPFGTPEFFAEVAAAEKSVTDTPTARPGTLGALIKAYRASHYFAQLKPRTRRDYDKVLNYLGEMDGLPLRTIDSPFVVKLRDRVYGARKRRFANYCLAVLSVVMEYGRECGELSLNPVRGVRKIRRKTDEPRRNRPWTTAERRAALNSLPLHLALPVAIARWTGLREGDVLRLRASNYDGQTIRIVTSKRSVAVAIPVALPLKDYLDRSLRSAPVTEAGAFQIVPDTICRTSRGQSWTESGFRASFSKAMKELKKAGLVAEGLTFHGLRHSVATDLAELGFDDRTIADMLGQESEEMPAHYSRYARLERKLKGVVRKLERSKESA